MCEAAQISVSSPGLKFEARRASRVDRDTRLTEVSRKASSGLLATRYPSKEAALLRRRISNHVTAAKKSNIVASNDHR